VNRPIEQHPGILLHDIARLFRQGFSHQLRDLGLTEPQWRVLGSINSFPGIRQSQLADLLGIGRATLGKLVDRLEAEALIVRQQDPDDRRGKQLEITITGKPIANLIRRRYQKFQSALLKVLDQRAVEELERSLGQLYSGLSGQSVSELLPGDDTPTLMLLIAIINRLNSRSFDQQLKQLGFTRNQWLVLVAIAKQEGLQQSELAREMNMNKAPLGNLIDDLERTNRVQRQAAPGDRRAYELHLTDDCKSGMRALTQQFEDMHEHAVGTLGQRQRQQFSKSLESIRAQLKTMAREQQATAAEITQ
jgi:MarR family transcriptional regulator for hemolysin